MQLRFLKQWRRNLPGTQKDLPDGMATTLIKRGFAMEVVTADVQAAPAPTVRAKERRR